MKRPILRKFLIVSLLLSSGFAAWGWFRPYAWGADAAARCQVVETLVTRDQGYFWVNAHLKVLPGMTHDLEKPVYLETASHARLEPADTTFGGEEGKGTTEIWLKFWLEPSQLEGPLTLRLNDARLVVKAGNGIPDLGSSPYRNFTTNHW